MVNLGATACKTSFNTTTNSCSFSLLKQMKKKDKTPKRKKKK